jgi:hypothetical protein
MIVDEQIKAELVEFIRKVNCKTRHWEVTGAQLVYAQGLELLRYGLTLEQTLSVLATILYAAKPDTALDRLKRQGYKACKRKR